MAVTASRYTFGNFTLDLRRGALLHEDVEVKLRPKSFAVLHYLVERAGELVAKDELMNAVWGSVVVTEGSLTQCLIDVRRALGDEDQALVRTVPRRGYLFDTAVRQLSDHEARLEPPSAATTPTGIAPSTVDDDPEAPVPLQAAFITAFVVVLVALSVTAWWRISMHRAAMAVPANSASSTPAASAQRATPPANSIAVLPFVNMSADPDQAYFSDGISEEILNALAQSPTLHVIARTSSFAFKQRQNLGVDDIAARLNVAYVLEGSVRKSGDRVRITAQLVDGRDSSHLWSETYDRPLADALDVQSDVAARVAHSLKVTLASALPQHEAALHYDPAATEAYLRGMYFYWRRAPGDAERARASFEKTLRIEPRHVRAWAWLARVYGVQVSVGALGYQEGVRLRRRAVDTALAIDPDLAVLQMTAAEVAIEADDPEGAAKHVLRAYDLDPNDMMVLSWVSDTLGRDHRFEEVEAVLRKQLSLDPLSSMLHQNFALVLASHGHPDEARHEFAAALEISPGSNPFIDMDLARILVQEKKYGEALEQAGKRLRGYDRTQVEAMAYDGLGRRSEADAAINRLAASHDVNEAVRLAEVYGHRGDANAAFRWIRTAYDRVGPHPWETGHDEALWVILSSPFIKPLQNDPRWAALEDQLIPHVLREVDRLVRDRIT
jgi:TolB-like protein/DNA-binding winged helix-turn-helix (wHTH) protein/Tfp pilus assembly protein PilF